MATGKKDNKGRSLKKGEGQRADGRYYFSFRDATGKQHFIYATDLLTLREKEEEVQQRLANGLNFSSDTLNDFFEMFLKIRTDLRPNSRKLYEQLYQLYCEQTLGKRKVSELKYNDFLSLYMGYASDGMAKNTLRGLAIAISHALGYAIRANVIQSDVSRLALSDALKVTSKPPKRKALTPTQQANFLLALEAFPKWQPLFTVLLGTGLRISEALGLSWDCVDFSANELRIERQLANDASGFYMQGLKTEQSKRAIPMSSTVRAALLEVKQREKIACLVDGHALVFQSVVGSGKAIGRSTVHSAMMRIIKVWNSEHPQDSLPMCSPHSLRHSFITRLAENGVDVKVTATLAGHSNTKTTLDIYTDLSNQHLHKNADKLESIFSAV